MRTRHPFNPIKHFLEPPDVRFDRSIAKTAKSNATGANSVASEMGSNAAGIYSSTIPGLEREAQTPTGFTPEQKNRQLVAGAETAGGAAAGAGGASTLEKLRTRSPSGFSAALDEASRIKQRQLGQNTLGVENEDARLGLERQQEAQRMLQGYYNTDTGNQLKAMGLANEDLDTALKAGQQGWLQNTLATVGTIGKLGAKPFGGGAFG
jgi:hypothetical protein